MQTSIITDAGGTRLVIDAETEIERALLREIGSPMRVIKMNGSQLVVQQGVAFCENDEEAEPS